VNEQDKYLIIKKLREEEQRLAEEARNDAFPVPPGTPRFGAFAEDNPKAHKRYASTPGEEMNSEA